MNKPEIRFITSHANADIKMIRSLNLRKYREETGLFVAEGMRHVLEALEAGWKIHTLVVEESVKDQPRIKSLVEQSRAKGVECLYVTRDILSKLTKKENAQTVIAVIHQQWETLENLKLSEESLWVVLEEIRDPGNLGTILRTADATAVEGIILVGNTCDPYSVESIRASMGSFPHVRLVRCSRQDFIGWAPRSGALRVGTHLAAKHSHRQAPYKLPLLLLMGNEQAGLSEDLSALCQQLIKIPMWGKADSLNVSIATALMLYEIRAVCSVG